MKKTEVLVVALIATLFLFAVPLPRAVEVDMRESYIKDCVAAQMNGFTYDFGTGEWLIPSPEDVKFPWRYPPGRSTWDIPHGNNLGINIIHWGLGLIGFLSTPYFDASLTFLTVFILSTLVFAAFMVKSDWRQRSLRKNTRAMILPGVIAITFIILSSIIWLVGALIVNRTFDGLAGIIAECDPRVAQIGQNVLNAYAVSIVAVDVLLLVWWWLSAQKKESQEEPGGFY